jgi:hypothetical protein
MNYTICDFINLGSFDMECSTLQFSLSPWWVTGFVDGEGSFSIRIVKKMNKGLGYTIQLVFRVGQLSKDTALINQIKIFFGCGYVQVSTKYNFTTYVTSSLVDAFTIIDHFNKYPLETQKAKDFKDWEKVAYMLRNKEHYTREGFDKIMSIKQNMNRNRKV